MLDLPNTKSGVNIKTRFCSVSYYDVWVKLALHRPIQGFGIVESMCTPYFQVGFDIWQANELLMKSFLKEGSNPWFCLSLKDFTDNYVMSAWSNLIVTHVF